MGSDNRAVIERLDLVERGNPLLPLLRIRFGKIKVDVVLHRVAGDYKPDRRDVQTGRMIRISVTKFNGDKFIPFQVD